MGFCSNWGISNEQTPRPPSSTHTQWFWSRHHGNFFVILSAIRAVRVVLSNLSTQPRPEELVSHPTCAGSGPPCTKVVTHDSEQISPAIIAHHTVYEKTQNLQRSPCLSIGNAFVPSGSAISSRGRTSFCAIAVKGYFALDNSCKYVVVVVVFFTLTDQASTIPSNTRGCQSGTWSAGQKKIRGTSTKLQ